MAVFRALWEEQRDVADPATMASCLGTLPDDLVARASAPAVQARLVANSEAAYQRGIFGVPSFVLREEVFFGADRLDLLLASLDWS
jgi:carboxymethylenebutenolidase